MSYQINNIHDAEKQIDEIISEQIRYHMRGDYCQIVATFLSFSMPITKPGPDASWNYKDYLLTFYRDTDSDSTIDKIHQNIMISKSISEGEVIQIFFEVMRKYSFFSNLFTLDQGRVIGSTKEFSNAGFINHDNILKINRSRLNGSSNNVARNRVLFTSNMSMLIYDDELEILIGHLEKLGRYDLLL